MSDHLRDYQIKAIDAVFREWETVQSTALCQATGTGKTVELAEIVKRAQPKRALILAHRRELVHQARNKIQKFTDLNAQVEMAGERARLDLFTKCHALVSSVQSQTPGRRSKPEDIDILIIDEMHHWKEKNKSYQDVIDHYRQNPNLKILGLTATIDAASRAMVQSVAFTYDILDAIKDGYLVPIDQKMVTIHGLDYSDIKTTRGDLNGSELAAVLEEETICQRMLQATLEVMFGVPQGSLEDLPPQYWGQFLFLDGRPKKNLVFTASVDQARMMSEIFNRVKPNLSAWVCGDANLVSEDERDRIGREFNSGDLLIVCNCGVYSEGYDNPNIEMVTMARPTKSRTLFIQQIGRGTRILDGVIDGLQTIEERTAAIEASRKKAVLVLDFVGNCGKHKLISSADIIGDFSESVKERAKKKAEASEKPRNILELLKESADEEKAEKQAAEERRRAELERIEAERKAHILAKSSYSLTSTDPFEKYGVKKQKATWWDLNHAHFLSDKQRNVIRNMGVNPDEISISCAKKLIAQRFAHPTPKQAEILKKHGYSTDCTFKEASAILDALAKNGWRRPEPELAYA